MKEWILNVILLLFSSIICLVIGEVALRIVAPEFIEFQRAMVFSDLTVRKLKPNIERTLIHPPTGEPAFFLTTNAMGLRSDVEIQLQVPPNTKRILCLGDSYTFGYGVEAHESYPQYLERFLNQRPNNRYRYQVINAGFASGFSTDGEYLYLREIGIRFSPDVVIVGFCIINDLVDISKNIWELDKDGRLEKIFNRTDRVIPVFLRRTAISSVLRAYLKPKEIFSKDRQPIDTSAIDRSQLALAEIEKLGKKKGFKLLVLIIPPPELVGDKGRRGFAWDETRKELIRFCKRNEISYLDLLDGLVLDHFLSGNSGKIHFNREGNQWLAERICDHLKSFL